MSDKAEILNHPAVNPETKHFWEAAEAGQLYVKHCNSCGENHFYPRAQCPYCRSLNTSWLQSTGKGTIYSYTVMRRASPPCVVAYVTLDEGPSMFTNIVDCDFDALKIGDQVKAKHVYSADGLPIAVFVPSD